MFGIGLGEIVIIALLVFLVCPRDIPRILRKIGQIMAGWKNLKDEMTSMADDIDLSNMDPKNYTSQNENLNHEVHKEKKR